MITTFLRWIAQETKTSMNWHIYLWNWLAIKRSCFTLFQENLQKEKTKLIHKALLTLAVIVNVNKLSWFLKKHYFVQSFFNDRKLQNHFSIRQHKLDFWSWKQQDVKINSFVTCIEMFLCGHRHMTFRLWHILCAEEGSTTIFKWNLKILQWFLPHYTRRRGVQDMSLLVHSGVEFFLELLCDVWNEEEERNQPQQRPEENKRHTKFITFIIAKSTGRIWPASSIAPASRIVDQ